MNRTNFQELMEKEFQSLIQTNNTKGHDYAGRDDALSNFKRHGDTLGLRPEQIWAVYANKHWDSIMTFVREGNVASEPIEGRIHDLILYGFLLLGLVTENKAKHEAFLMNKEEESYT